MTVSDALTAGPVPSFTSLVDSAEAEEGVGNFTVGAVVALPPLTSTCRAVRLVVTSPPEVAEAEVEADGFESDFFDEQAATGRTRAGMTMRAAIRARLLITRRTLASHTGDELFDPLINAAKRVFAQHGAGGLVVELEVNPVNGEVPPMQLSMLDELPAKAGTGGLRRD